MKATKEEVDKFLAGIRNTMELADSEAYPLDSIPGFLSSLSQKQIFNVHEAILNSAEIRQEIANMGENSQYYKKRNSKDPNMRSFCITRDINGEFRLFIEPKSKRFDNTKRMIKWLGGSFKTRKLALRTDVAVPELYASLIAICGLDDLEILKDLEHEIATQQKLSKVLGIAPLIRGGNKIKLVGVKQVPMHRYIIYSPYRDTDLNLFLHYKHKLLTPEFRAHMVQSLLNIFKKLHDTGFEHKDLKAENVLIHFNKSTNSYEFELIDYGFIQKFGAPDKVRGTPNTIPAWIFKNKFCGNSFNSIKDKEYTDSICYAMLNKLIIDKKAPLLAELRIKSYGKHDIWSLLVLFHKILYPDTFEAKEQLKECQSDEFLKIFLGLRPEDLPNIDQAIDAFNNSKYYALATAYQPQELTGRQTSSNIPTIDFDQIIQTKQDPNNLERIFFEQGIGVVLQDHTRNLDIILNSSSIRQLQKVTTQLSNQYIKIGKLYEKAIKNQSEMAEPRMVVQYYASMLCLAYKKLDQFDRLKTRGFFSQVKSCVPSSAPKYFDKAEKLEDLVKDILAKQYDDNKFVSKFKSPY